MVRIGLMTRQISWTSRRDMIAALLATTLASHLPRPAAARQASQSLMLQAKAASTGLQPGEAELPVWTLQPSPPTLRLRRGQLDVTLQNDLPTACVLNWCGLDGAAAVEPLTAQAPLAPGGRTSLSVALRHAGTYFCDLRLLADSHGPPVRPLPLVVEEDEPVGLDRDEIFLIEKWQPSGGTALAPGAALGSQPAIYSVNGRISPDITMRGGERLRLRFINGCQFAVVALKIESLDVWVMALDGQPAEPFVARNGAIALAPGGRADIFVDATAPAGSASSILLHDGREARPVARLVTSVEPPVRPAPRPPAAPLPSNGLPRALELKNALRVDLALGGPDWIMPSSFAVSTPPAFQAGAGRIVVLALTNRTGRATSFHLHGHHFRLLDRLDDGWKPFWLDTLAIEPGQTQRVAFAAEHAGRFLIEQVGTDWSAPRLVRWYGVS